MSEWKECKLGDIAEIQTGPFGSQLHQSDYVASGIPSIMPTNIGSRLNIVRSNLAFIESDDAKRLSKYLVDEGDIVYSRRGDVEKCAYIRNDEVGWLCGTGCLRIRINKCVSIPRFIAYYLSTEESKGWISNNAVGSTMPNLNSSILQDVPLSLPSLFLQEQLAGVLSSLDDKIDLLTRQNRTLEAMAETLFRQYFIENPKEDWKDGKLSDICCLRNKKQSIAETTLAQYISTENMLSDKMGIVEATSLPTNGNGTVYYLGDILVSNIRPYFKKIWLADKDGICSNDVLCFTSHCDEIHNSYIYYILRQNDFFEYVMLGSKGCKMPRGDKDHIKNYPIYIPDRETLHNFHHFIEPNITKIQNNQAQIRSLTKLRDTLLPKLMNNEIKI